MFVFIFCEVMPIFLKNKIILQKVGFYDVSAVIFVQIFLTFEYHELLAFVFPGCFGFVLWNLGEGSVHHVVQTGGDVHLACVKIVVQVVWYGQVGNQTVVGMFCPSPFAL